jgi:protein-S-isoprenylcysteine O-methyltransferase Ste14
LASSSLKLYFKKKFNLDRYYRLVYTTFVTILLVVILWYQYSLKSILLWNSSYWILPSLLFLILPGGVIVFISIKKYFFLLSGIQAVFKKTPVKELKITGIHRFVRHPLYTGTIMMVWGFFLLFPYLYNLIAVVLLTLYVIIGIRFEEKKLIAEFGSKYLDYMKKVPPLIPRIF